MRKLVKESLLLEKRFSSEKITFNQNDVNDACLDALFYLNKIKENLAKVKDLPKEFKFDLAIEKLEESINRISEATGTNQTKD